MASEINSVSAAAGTPLANAIRDVYSAEMWLVAMPTLKFDQFTTKKTELGVQRGRSITMTKMSGIKRGGRLSENRPMPTQSMHSTTTQITVGENGNGIAITEALVQASFYDQMSAASLLLGRDMALVLDTQVRDVFIGASGASTIFADNVAARTNLVTGMGFSTDLVRRAVEILETNNAPKWYGDHYVSFVHPHQVSSIRKDPDWLNASYYAGSQQVYTGEIGRWLDVRFIMTTVMPNGANNAVDPHTDEYADVGYNPALRVGNAGNLTNVYQSVLFGENSVGHATALPTELRDNGVDDFGRRHGIAWFSIWGEDELESKHIVIMETA